MEAVAAEATCPGHGREKLVNAGAPFVVRCCACGTVYERCSHCLGQPVKYSGETATYCPDCIAGPHPGWQARNGPFGHPYPVS